MESTLSSAISFGFGSASGGTDVEESTDSQAVHVKKKKKKDKNKVRCQNVRFRRAVTRSVTLRRVSGRSGTQSPPPEEEEALAQHPGQQEHHKEQGNEGVHCGEGRAGIEGHKACRGTIWSWPAVPRTLHVGQGIQAQPSL